MPTLSVLEKWVPSLTQRQNYAWQLLRSARHTGLYTFSSSRIPGVRGVGRHPDPKRKILGSSQVPVLLPVPLKVQCLQIASLNLVPCALGGAPSVPSDESTPQSLRQRKHERTHKPPTVHRGKTRLLQRKNFPPLLNCPAQRPFSYRREGEVGRESESSHPRVHTTQGIPRTLAPTRLGLVSGSRR